MKNLNKKQKIIASIMVILIGILAILTIVFGVEYGQEKGKLKEFKVPVTLDIDIDGDTKEDYTFTFTDLVAGKSLEDVLENDLPSDCPFKFNISKGFLNAITYAPGKTIANKTGVGNSGDDWLIYSSTDSHIMDPTSTDKEKETSVGMSDLLMGPTNEYMFSYQHLTW